MDGYQWKVRKGCDNTKKYQMVIRVPDMHFDVVDSSGHTVRTVSVGFHKMDEETRTRMVEYALNKSAIKAFYDPLSAERKDLNPMQLADRMEEFIQELVLKSPGELWDYARGRKSSIKNISKTKEDILNILDVTMKALLETKNEFYLYLVADIKTLITNISDWERIYNNLKFSNKWAVEEFYKNNKDILKF